STRNYDQGEKFALYRQIPTLKEYILIDSEQIKVIFNSKNENSSWNLTEFTSINDIFEIKSLEVEMRLVDIYEDVIFVK
ncbi:MAG: Uma2 family endonuclease, partial [Flavobacterium sp.]|nr:Uma2 family endonuclease [Flavobacterium sp.]